MVAECPKVEGRQATPPVRLRPVITPYTVCMTTKEAYGASEHCSPGGLPCRSTRWLMTAAYPALVPGSCRLRATMYGTCSRHLSAIRAYCVTFTACHSTNEAPRLPDCSPDHLPGSPTRWLIIRSPGMRYRRFSTPGVPI